MNIEYEFHRTFRVTLRSEHFKLILKYTQHVNVNRSGRNALLFGTVECEGV